MITGKKTALDTLTSFAHCWEKRDMDGLLNHLSQTKKIVMYGTGSDEKLIGHVDIKKQVMRDWQQSDAASMEFLWNAVDTSGSVSWISSDVRISAIISGTNQKYEGRLTTVWVEEDYIWRLVQWHLSLPQKSQNLGLSFPQYKEL